MKTSTQQEVVPIQEQVVTKKVSKPETYKCCICTRNEKEMFFNASDPEKIYCLGHAEADMTGFSTVDVTEQKMFCRDGVEEITEVMIGYIKETETFGPIQFHSAVTTRNQYGRTFMFTDHGLPELKELAAGEGDEI